MNVFHSQDCRIEVERQRTDHAFGVGAHRYIHAMIVEDLFYGVTLITLENV